ncbi:hypothetical protein BJX61DRAFT_549351 [Aspergillus egyptiacus]|nr:hypothetical protein BJX61DRAFT_549351 [Aspergillus egyptiacus]
MASFATDVDLTESRGAEINVVAWVFTGIAIGTVFLKLTARQLMRRLGWDDFFIFFSLGLSIIAAALVSYSVTLGLGRHTAAVVADHGMDRVTLTAKWQILGYRSFSFPNISISILINNLLEPNPLRARLLLGMSIMQVIFALVSVFLVFLQCSPTAGLWDHSLEASCWPESIFYDFSYWVSAYTTMTDIVLAFVPISIFSKLQMRRSTKVGVCIMMGLTLLSAIVTIVKATYLPLFTDKEDPLYNVAPLVIWGLIEQNVVIVAACIPTLRPFFRRAFESKDHASSSHPSRTRSFPLSSNPTHGGSKRLSSISAVPVDHHLERLSGRNIGYDRSSNSSQKGIWQTSEVIVESDEENEETQGGMNMANVVPPNLR